MKLTFFQCDPPNFGDELNNYIWPRILPAGFLDDDESELFVGIGSIFGDMYPKESVKHVVGSGYAGYFPAPDIEQSGWNVVFVRGPETAKRFGLAPEKSICDSGILIREVRDLPSPATGIDVAFMPHFDSLPRGNWAKVCKMADVTMIDPTSPTDVVLAQLRGARLVITEAMHGAIIADALRTPWVAIRPFHHSHRLKWSDWSGSLGLDINWQGASPSSAIEAVTMMTGRGIRTISNDAAVA